MSVFSQGLIEEMEEDYQNPLVAWLETLKTRRMAKRLVREHGEKMVRDLLLALSDVPDFPLAYWLWNADQPHLPLYCFFRTTSEPVFRVLKIISAPYVLTITIEYGSNKKNQATRETFTFNRDSFGRLFVAKREAA